jgi:hypothetical protein
VEPVLVCLTRATADGAGVPHASTLLQSLAGELAAVLHFGRQFSTPCNASLACKLAEARSQWRRKPTCQRTLAEQPCSKADSCPASICCFSCSAVMLRTFDGLARGYKGSLVPVLSTELSLFDTVRKLDHLQGSVLPTSSRKISHCKVCWPILHTVVQSLWRLRERRQSFPYPAEFAA